MTALDGLADRERHGGGSSGNLPAIAFGVAEFNSGVQVCIRAEQGVFGLADAVEAGHLVLKGIDHESLRSGNMNALLAQDKSVLSEMVSNIARTIAEPEHADQLPWERKQDDDLHCPVSPGDFIDFYSSYHHALRSMKAAGLADPEPPPNWFSMPVGYHSRTATIYGPGATIRRPVGQRRTRSGVEVGPSQSLDFELEVGFVTCGSGPIIGPIAVDAFENHVFGVLLLNDWSARDLQGWEARPLGPLLSKSFATQIGPWIIPLEALSAARRPQRTSSEVLPYLQGSKPWALDIDLQVAIETSHMRASNLPAETICQTNLQEMYWTVAQQLSHSCLNGAIIRPGDLFGTGTVSGPGDAEAGCLLEKTMAGRQPVSLQSGEARSWLEDGDRILLSGSFKGSAGLAISLGRLSGTVVTTPYA